MYLNLSRQPLPIKRRTDKRFRHFDWTSAFDLDQVALLDNICHFLLLLLSLICFFLQLSNLPRNIVEAVRVGRTVRNRTNKSGIGIFKGCIVLLTRHLARGLEIDTKVGKITFIILADIFYGVDMQRHGKAVDWQNDSLGLPVNVNL